MKYLCLLLIQFVLSTACFSQFKNISIQAGTNYTFIPSVETQATFTSGIPTSSSGYTTYTSVAGLKESFEGKTGFFLGGRTDIDISQKFFFTTGLHVQYLRFRRTTKVLTDDDDNYDFTPTLPGHLKIIDGVAIGGFYSSLTEWGVEGEFTPRIPVDGETIISGNTENMGKTTTLYLQIPVLFGSTFLKNKVTVRGGFNFSYLLNASEYQLEYSFSGVSEKKVHTRDGYTKLLASGMMMVSYHPTQKLSIDFSGNTYLSPIFDTTESPSKKAKYNTLSLGMSYTLLSR